ncbi:MAG: hypothetical protein H0A75_05470 [Candidatus Methanofishera endochildressiae]|uniref:Uncharacterized protein n=1 Tax=Candidatus Methanofishera endochildressiae TaxID=2738884 RepID=A0A7Z0MNU5_9GAMM|nr:hypothetical protein [Candidatus Methanofishera endochildressiae]
MFTCDIKKSIKHTNGLLTFGGKDNSKKGGKRMLVDVLNEIFLKSRVLPIENAC